MAGEVSFQTTETDYLLAAKAFNLRQVRSRRYLGRIIMSTGFALILVALGLMLLGTPVLEALMLGIVGTLAGMAALVPVLALNHLLLPRRVKRLFAQSKSQHGSMTFGWSADEAFWQSIQAEQRVPWSHYHCWLENKSVYLFYLNDTLYQFLPRHVLTPAQDLDLHSTLIASGLTRR